MHRASSLVQLSSVMSVLPCLAALVTNFSHSLSELIVIVLLVGCQGGMPGGCTCRGAHVLVRHTHGERRAGDDERQSKTCLALPPLPCACCPPSCTPHASSWPALPARRHRFLERHALEVGVLCRLSTSGSVGVGCRGRGGRLCDGGRCLSSVRGA